MEINLRKEELASLIYVFIQARRQKCNPIELRKAKIVYNFGLSECNRVNGVNYFFSKFLLGHLLLTLLRVADLKSKI